MIGHTSTTGLGRAAKTTARIGKPATAVDKSGKVWYNSRERKKMDTKEVIKWFLSLSHFEQTSILGLLQALAEESKPKRGRPRKLKPQADKEAA